MCVGRHVRRYEASSTSSLVQRTLNHAHTYVTSYPATWSRTYRQPMKPMLPRKLTSSARINLNQYWNILEELVPCNITAGVQDGDVDMSNEINENMANERLEQSREQIFKCETRHGNSDVATSVSLDSSKLWESSGDCAHIQPKEMLDSRCKYVSFSRL